VEQKALQADGDLIDLSEPIEVVPKPPPAIRSKMQKQKTRPQARSVVSDDLTFAFQEHLCSMIEVEIISDDGHPVLVFPTKLNGYLHEEQILVPDDDWIPVRSPQIQRSSSSALTPDEEFVLLDTKPVHTESFLDELLGLRSGQPQPAPIVPMDMFSPDLLFSL
jgi:hypothetical protein